jgi:peptidoglycan hydrolase-like protein with peptidoglycan-binding domain
MKKQIIIIALVVVIAIAIYAYLNPEILEKIGLKKAVDQGSGNGSGTGTDTAVSKKIALPAVNKDKWPLEEGKSGSLLNPSPAVKELQKYMNAGGANLVEDGIYGPRTKAALKSREYPLIITWDDYLNILDLN